MCNANVRVSVVVPMYNGGDAIKACLYGLDNQDTEDVFEVIVVDDASTDNSVSIVKNFILKLKKSHIFRVIECEKNGRCGKARNIGVEQAKGEYILFVDQDDYPDEKLIRVLLEKAQNGKYDLVSCAMIDKDGKKRCRPSVVEENSISENIRNKIMRNYSYVFATLIKKSIVVDNKLKFAENVFFEDTIYNMGVICCSNSINNTEEVLYYRRTDEESQTSFLTPRKLNDRINSVLQYQQMFSGNKNIELHKEEIDLVSFYYIYLSVVLWIVTLPHLFDMELFKRALNEGKKLNVNWFDVYKSEKGIHAIIIFVLMCIYYVPWLVYPTRGLGRLCYFVVHSMNKRKKENL